MSDVQASAAQTPVDAQPDVALASATTTFEVKAEHSNLIMRTIALLERGEQWIKDNIEAGVTHFEALVTDNTASKDTTQDADVTE